MAAHVLALLIVAVRCISIVARVLCDGSSAYAACQWQPVHCGLVVVHVLCVGGTRYAVCWAARVLHVVRSSCAACRFAACALHVVL